ncbi:MAG: KEOPS complex subunit Pcc1 [Nanobdellota archaeon]
MNYTSTITVDTSSSQSAVNLVKLFETEDSVLSNGRGSYVVSSKDAVVEFSITAKDPTALRAVLNTITKVCTVYEKTGNIN